MRKNWPDFLAASPSPFLTTIELFIVWLLEGASRPSAGELLRAVEQATGSDASRYFYLSGYVAGEAIPQGVTIDLIAKVAGELERMAKGLLPAPKPRPVKAAKKT